MQFIKKEYKNKSNNRLTTYYDEGTIEDHAIVFIHGFPLNKSMWNKQIEEFKINQRVIAYDIRGFGNSEAGDVEFSIELFTNDLIDLLDELTIENCILCGFSMGGYIALNAVSKFPDRFTALILCDTNCAADSQETKENRMKTINKIQSDGMENYAEESLKKLFAPNSLKNHKDEISLVREMILHSSDQSIFKTLHALANRSETCTKLGDINIPVLILVGKEDSLTPPVLSLSMHEKFSNSKFGIIENAGHTSNLENPIKFNKYIVEFLSSIKEIK
jgi:3-oxoadipate enol-lactonase